jgi:hypothetical protein
MKNAIEWLSFLGSYVGSKKIEILFQNLDIKKNPVLNKNDTDTFVQKYDDGLELTFTLESLFDSSVNYPEEALVLTNIRFYLDDNKKHKAFTGSLPFGLPNAMDKKTINEVLGAPDSENAKFRQFKWIKENTEIYCYLNESDLVVILSIKMLGV